LLLLLATVVAAACAEAADPVGPETVLAHAVETSRVVGSGHVESAAGLREFTFHAVEHPDGSAAGSFKVVLPSGLFFEADVTCLSVEGTTGWVGGVIRDTNAEIVVIGSTSMFYAIDDGEGGESADVVSTAAFNAAAGADLAFCENRPLELPPMTVTDGNVQVR
jgi:hypothetical protein